MEDAKAPLELLALLLLPFWARGRSKWRICIRSKSGCKCFP